jgi:hypothetical protein
MLDQQARDAARAGLLGLVNMLVGNSKTLKDGPVMRGGERELALSYEVRVVV